MAQEQPQLFQNSPLGTLQWVKVSFGGSTTTLSLVQFALIPFVKSEKVAGQVVCTTMACKKEGMFVFVGPLLGMRI